jgi:uncharacterized membrane protein
MPSVLAGIASLLWGGSDFLGGIASKRIPARAAGAIVQGTGVAIVLVVLLIWPAHPRGVDLWLGVIAGIASAVGISLLYAALAVGPMYVVAPTTAAIAAALQAVVGLAIGQRPSSVALVGVVVAIVAIALLATPPTGMKFRANGRVLAIATGAGCMIAIITVCFSRTATSSGAWPGGMARVVAAAILIPIAIIGRRERPRGTQGALRLAVIAGVADIVATLAIMFALQRGSLVILGVLGGLYPVVTILLARFVLEERMGTLQKVAVILAMFAIVLIAVG